MAQWQADTVIVGAGAAGAVIATRMTERADREVLLLEAGPDYPDPAHLPPDLLDGTRNSFDAHDWGFRHRVNSQQVVPFRMPRGRVVGGSSAVNTCIALRGVPADYDEWAALGLPDWSWDRCLPAFKRLETDHDIRDAWHGTDGPLPIRRHTRDELTPWHAAFLDACATLGLPRSDDHNNPTATGYGPNPMNKLGGVRMGAGRSYLTAAVRGRPNLTLRANVTVRRVLFDNRRAVGLEIEHLGVVRTVRAGRVVLSAGALSTPGLLLRSGVGPRASIDRLAVTQVAEVPGVGARLLDHPGAAFFLLPRAGVRRAGDPIIQTSIRFRSRHGRMDNDLQVQPGSAVILPQFSLPLVSMMCHVGKPRGTGQVVYPRADPNARPVITSRLLDDPYDRALAVEALRMAYEITRAAPMRDMARVVWPSDAVVARDDRLDGWVRRVCDSGYHPCGTVPMGPDSDPLAAVDAWGHVRGVEGLMVADASLMPTVPTSNIHLPTLMIGERMGAWLRDGEI